MPGLTVATDAAPARPVANANHNAQSTTDSRPSSPTRPPVSPITPTLGPAHLPALPPSENNGNNNNNNMAPPAFAQGRPALTHSQPDQVGVPPPAPVPVPLDENPDALALKSAISILQLQRAKAARDAQALARAKADALADPAAFVADLTAGRVVPEGDKLFPGGAPRAGRGAAGNVGGDTEMADDDDGDADDDDDDDDDHDDREDSAADDGEKAKPEPRHEPPGTSAQHREQASGAAPRKGAGASSGRKSWQTLPKPQNVVRCPPINWAQYAVVGESLDKLHAEQQRAPAQGSPAVVGAPGGTYEFKGERAGAGEGLVGIAAPYTPGRDKLEKKTKGGRK